MKKWAVLLLLIFWITQTSARKKILFTGILIIANFLSVSIDLAFIAHLTGRGYDYELAHLISRTFGVLVMTTIFFIWIRNNEASILNSLLKLKLNTDLIKSKIPSLIIVLFIYAIAGNLVWGYLDFHLWIKFLFKTTQKILLVLGEEVMVEPNYLIGANGSLYMLRACLGFHTIFLFASLVYLTGIENIRRWIYIIIGVLFLNVVNIIRLVLLFMHVQKFGSYQLAIDVHDMYTYITYIIVFILWVIWFEFFTDIKSIFKGRVDKS